MATETKQQEGKTLEYPAMQTAAVYDATATQPIFPVLGAGEETPEDLTALPLPEPLTDVRQRAETWTALQDILRLLDSRFRDQQAQLTTQDAQLAMQQQQVEEKLMGMMRGLQEKHHAEITQLETRYAAQQQVIAVLERKNTELKQKIEVLENIVRRPPHEDRTVAAPRAPSPRVGMHYGTASDSSGELARSQDHVDGGRVVAIAHIEEDICSIQAMLSAGHFSASRGQWKGFETTRSHTQELQKRLSDRIQQLKKPKADLNTPVDQVMRP